MLRTLKTMMLVCLMLSLVACGSANGNNGTSGSDGDKVTLTVSSWRVEEIEAFKQINAKFNEKYPNIKIKYEPIKATEYDSALSTALETGSGPDLFYVRPFDRGLNLYKAGHLLEVNEKNVPNLKNISDTQESVYIDPSKKLFAVPYIYVSYGFLYNEKLFNDNGVEVPKTWDEFYTSLGKLKQAGVTPLALGTKDPWVLTEVVGYGNYANFVDGEEWRKKLIEGKAKVTDAGFVDFHANLQKWNQYMPDNYEGIGYTEAQQLFLAEQAAVFPSGSWEIGVFRSQNPNLKMGFFASPSKSAGDKQWVGFNGGAGLGVNPKSKHVDEALTYINWLASEEAQIMTGNLMAGLFPSANIDASKLEDPLAKAWLEAGGSKGENFAIGWGLVKVSEGNPGAYQLDSDNLPLLMNGDMTSQESTQKIQEGLDTWFKP